MSQRDKPPSHLKQKFGFRRRLGLRRNVHGSEHLSEQPTRKRASSRKARGPGALDRSRVACDLERVEVLPELDGPAVANRRDVGDLCFAFLSLPVKPEVIVAESHKDRKSTRLNSSHSQISYAVFCLKKKKNNSSIVSKAQKTLIPINTDSATAVSAMTLRLILRVVMSTRCAALPRLHRACIFLQSTF